MTSYDEVAYVSRPFRQTHPDRLATLAGIFGVPAVDPTRARVLDVGCGSGGNILPMAAAMPDASFFGFDLASTAVDAARRRAEDLGLANLRLETIDLMDFPADVGQFDYIIAHGFYSWVPDVVRERFWSFLDRHLSPHGIAYVSFNAYPGAMFRHIWRDAGTFHAGGIENIHERIRQSVEMLNLMASANVKRGRFDSILEEMSAAVRKKGVEWVSHDDFSPFFRPFYFHQVAESALEHNLHYLSDAVYYDGQPHEITPAAQPILEQLGGKNGILREQYYDFLELRAFRQILFCRDSKREQRKPDLKALRNFSFSSPAEITGAASDGSLAVRNSLTGMGGSVPVSFRRILEQLRSAWPCSLHFQEVAADQKNRGLVADALHTLWASALLEAHVTPLRCGDGRGPKPRVWDVARAEARAGQPVTSRLHAQMQLDEVSARLIELLDGTRTRAQLALQFDELDQRLAWIASMGLFDPAAPDHS